MALETGTYISDLVSTNPAGGDALAFSDDHLRLIKTTLKNTFPNVTGAVTKTQTQLNNTLDKSGDTMTGLLILSGAPSSSLHAATKQYVDTGDTGAVSSAVAAAGASAASLYPTKTGTGASGNWNINIFGNASTASSASVATSAEYVTNVSTSQVLNATAGASLGSVGSYAFMSCTDNTALSPGTTKPGTSLLYRGAQTEGGRFGSGNYVSTGGASGATGTWRLMGNINGVFEYGGVNTNHSNTVSLWLRIS